MKKNVITPMRRAMRRGIASMLLICGMCQPALAEEQSLLTLLFNDGHKQSYVLAYAQRLRSMPARFTWPLKT